LVLATAVVVVAAVLLLATLIALEGKYGPIDPTEPGWKAQVVNDLGKPVHVKSAAEDLLIPAGQSDILASPGPGQLHVVYTVTDSSGTTLGCLTVDLDKQRTVKVNASQTRPC
jgi:hypothetical protein